MIGSARVLLALAVLGTSPCVRAETMTRPSYPETRQDAVADTRFGETVPDPYRWLEGDVRTTPEVADWVARQNRASAAQLAALPGRAWFEERIRAHTDFERFGLPAKAGGRYFYTRNAGLQNQPQLWVRNGLDGAPRLLLDPNAWSAGGTAALDAWKPSPDGRYLLYSVQQDGSDWRVLRVVDAADGTPLSDEVRWAKFTNLAWVGSEGFLYSRFPPPAEGEAFQARNYNQAVWFHRIGTPQDQDVLVYATPDHPEHAHAAQVTADGRWALITSSQSTDARHELHVIDLARRDREGWRVRPLVQGFEHDWRLVEGIGRRLLLLTNQGAPRYRLVSVDLGRKEPQFREVLAERAEVLERGAIVGDKLVLSYLKDAASRAAVFDLRGRRAEAIELQGIGTAAGFRGRPGDPETFYSFASFNRPSSVYRLDLATGETRPFAEPVLGFDPHSYLIEQRFFRSKDGTRVPMFVVRKREIAAAGKAVPTLLYGYGGFDVTLTPGFSAARMAWLEAGGAFALANLRGGGEYGRDWYEAGRRANKQNVFDDFIAAAEYLVAEGIAAPRGLAIQGASNGGLLIGAVLNQRPDLFAAANPQVGVMDMLRFDRFTAGRYWFDDYGRPDQEDDFRVLRRYSPYHNIRTDAVYPPVLVTTGDTDDRVVPAHSFKYAAALQARAGGAGPHLLRVETAAGHGSGKPTDKAIEESADIMAFLAHWSGLRVPSNRSEK